jgi:hypothetical protein
VNNGKSVALIVFAWAMEVVGVTSGVVNSAYTTFGDNLPDTAFGYLPALPIVALAVAELGRVPLASALYHKRLVMKAVAVVGIVALGYLAIENWTFGFERIVDLRLKPVNMAGTELARAESELANLNRQRTRIQETGTAKRDELRLGVTQRETSIGKLTERLAQEASSHQQNLVQIREACRLLKERCMVPRSREEDERYAREVARINSELGRQHEERNQLQAELDKLTKGDAANLGSLDGKILMAGGAASQAKDAFRSAVDRSQIHRLAASWYGVHTTDVTAEQFASARLVFATFSAIAVALAGSVAALVYYAGNRVPGRPSFIGAALVHLVRARRAYYARKRRPITREVLGPERVVYRDGQAPPVVVEREVLRFVDRIILIPRIGIRVPTYINRLFANSTAMSPALVETGSGSNVMSLSKRGA